MTTAEPRTKYPGIVKKAYLAFFSPSRYEAKTVESEIMERGRNYRIPSPSGELAVTTWGETGPAVLLMHGWGGARAQMTGLVDPLLLAGYRVVAYDQPAHGESDGILTNLLQIAPTLETVQAKEGPFEAILAHSFGTLITSYALVHLNLSLPSRLVYFGAFNRLMDSLPRFQAAAGLPDEIAAGLQEMIYDAFGKHVLDSIVNDSLAPQVQVPALMFHDRADPVTPVEDSRAIASAWKQARLVETEGLGHRGALQSRPVLEQTVKFLKEGS